jgi:hypothetical protein
MTTTNKIQSLTPEQVAAMPEYVNKWTSIGASTEPTDEEKGTAAIVKMYKVAGYKAPKVYWLDSPLAATLMAAGFCSRLSARKVSRKSLHIGNQILDLMREQVFSQVSDRVYAQVADKVDRVTSYKVEARILQHIRTQIFSQVHLDEMYTLSGSHWGCWITGGLDTVRICAAYDFFANVLHLDIDREALAGLIGTTEQTPLIYTFRDRVFASRKMIKCSLNDKWRLHCENGPAILFNDGFSVYAQDGDRLPNGIVQK